MLDLLPPDVLATVASYLGEKPENFHRACRATWRVAHDHQALVMWVLRTWGAGSIFMLTSVRCVSKWQQEYVLCAVKQLLGAGCTLEDLTSSCVLFYFEARGFAQVLDLLLQHISSLHSSSTAHLRTLQVSLLKAACSKGHEACVHVLLQQGTDPNADNGRPLKAASEAGSANAVRALLAAGADVHAGGECALRVCAAAGSPAHVDVMRVLLEGGADVHAKHDEALRLAVERSNVDAVALLLAHGADARARQVLEAAAATGCARTVRLLLAHGADANADGGKPLRAAAGAGAVEVVRCLLDAGAHVGLGRRSLGSRPVPQPRTSMDGSYSQLGLAAAGSQAGSGGGPASFGRSSSAQGLVCMGCAGASGPVPACASGMEIDGLAGAGVDQQEEVGSAELNIDMHMEIDGEGQGAMGWDEEEEEEEGGAGALCAALCAGEGEVARVLLERGAHVSPAVLRCWRQWHRYPGITALLSRHPPTIWPHQHMLSHGAAAAAGSSAPHPPLFLASSSSFAPGSAPSAASGAWARMAALRMQSAAGIARRSLDGQAGVCSRCSSGATASALTLALRTELVAAAGEGAETAVRLLLQWAAPQDIPTPAAAAAAAVGLPAAATGSSACMRMVHGVPMAVSQPPQQQFPPSSSGSSIPASVLGALDAPSLSAALHEAVAANHPVVVQQLLAHCPSPLWRQAALRPSAVLAAVSEGHVEITQMLLAAGAGPAVLCVRPLGRPPASMAPAAGAAASNGTSVPCDDSPPPPPLQYEAWGTAVLCAAAACKRGMLGTALALVELLLQHGFGVCARDALRLAACGRVAPWREEVAARMLSAALGDGPALM